MDKQLIAGIGMEHQPREVFLSRISHQQSIE